MATNHPSDTVADHGDASEMLRRGSTLEQVCHTFPGSQIVDSLIVMEPGTIYANDGNAEVRYAGISEEQAARRDVDTGD